MLEWEPRGGFDQRIGTPEPEPMPSNWLTSVRAQTLNRWRVELVVGTALAVGRDGRDRNFALVPAALRCRGEITHHLVLPRDQSSVPAPNTPQ